MNKRGEYDMRLTAKHFSRIIEDLVKNSQLTYLEAITYYCQKNQLETDKITKWIDPGMKEKIQYDAEQLNYLPKTSSLF